MRLTGKRVRVYRNVTKNCYSVLYKGRVIAHRKRILLAKAKFIVRLGGWKKFQQTHVKNVHAFVEGDVVGTKGILGIDKNGKNLPVKLGYNPTKGPCFFHNLGLSSRCVDGAEGVLLNESGMSAAYIY